MTFWQALLQEAGNAQTWAGRAVNVLVTALVAALLFWLIVFAERRVRPALLRRAEAAPGAKAAHARTATTAVSLLGSLARWGVLLLAALYILAALGVNLWPLLTGIGFLGAALAFGAQSLVRDLVTGLFILLEGEYGVGEYVTLNGIFGQVAAVSLRTTALDTPDGKRQYFPNGSINTVAVYPEPISWYELTVPLATAQQVTALAGPLTRLAEELRAVFPERVLEVREAEAYAEGRLVHGLRLMVAVRPGCEWLATEELVGRTKGLLESRKITAPGGLAPAARARQGG
jgi:small conductance mechanosensitive channel